VIELILLLKFNQFNQTIETLIDYWQLWIIQYEATWLTHEQSVKLGMGTMQVVRPLGLITDEVEVTRTMFKEG
jgi:hypothetical protein